MIRNNMVDAIVSTGANIVDQDFFEELCFRQYIAGDELKYGIGDGDLRELMIDRIYDTFIDEEELRICDDDDGEDYQLAGAEAAQLAGDHPGVWRGPGGEWADAGEWPARRDYLCGVSEGRAHLLPGVLGLLGGLRVCGAPACAARAGDGVDRLG